MDNDILKAELQGASYKNFIASGNDSGIAELLNDPASSLAGPVSLSVMPRGKMLLALIPAVAALASLDPAKQIKWDRYLGLAQASDTIGVKNAAIQALLDMAVKDGLLTQQQRSAIGTRQGSRAEVLFGANTSVSLSDVSFALRNLR